MTYHIPIGKTALNDMQTISIYYPSPLTLRISDIMAKGSKDVILRDRLQFEINSNGNTSLVYGRIDLSDYVSIVKNEGLAIKEIRFQFRNPNSLEAFPTWLGGENLEDVPTGQTATAYVRAFATTTAYENATDIGIASPNVICMYEQLSTVYSSDLGGQVQAGYADTQFKWFGTPDLHPEGYDVVTDLLIGVNAVGCLNSRIAGETVELDVMLIAEPKKITQKDLTQMLSQAQDL